VGGGQAEQKNPTKEKRRKTSGKMNSGGKNDVTQAKKRLKPKGQQRGVESVNKR